MLSRLRIATGLTALGLVLGACGDTGTVPEPAPMAKSAPTAITQPTTTTVDVVPPVDEAFLVEQVDRVLIPESRGAVMAAVVAADGEVVYAARGTDPEGDPPTPDATFRVGSITKVFTSLVTLTLVDDGLVELDAAAVDYITRIPVPEEVTVRDLLQHTSGLPHTDDQGLSLLARADPERVWTPEEVVESTITRRPLFPPGTSFDYSNSNYVVLGVLIEEVTGRPFAEVLRGRIIEPLGMNSTYLAGFEDGPEPFGAYATTSPFEVEPIDFDYTSIATMAGATGSVVSSARDLHALSTALFDGQVLSVDTLAEMIENPRHARGWEPDYGLGIEVWHTVEGRPVKGLVGHGGWIEGYETLVLHAPETGMTAFWVATSDHIDTDPAWAAVAERVSGTQ